MLRMSLTLNAILALFQSTIVDYTAQSLSRTLSYSGYSYPNAKILMVGLSMTAGLETHRQEVTVDMEDSRILAMLWSMSRKL